MRLPFARLACGLLPAAFAVAGCHRGADGPDAKVSTVATPGPSSPPTSRIEERPATAIAKPARRRRWDDPEPIIVRARYGTEKGACVVGSDGSVAMPVVDTFTIVEVIRGEPRATDIAVRPGYPVDSDYPRSLAIGEVVTLRVRPARDEWERLGQENGERHRRLNVDPEDVDRIAPPTPSPQ
jgi:hypothetical protein